jgi:hypothetical protein
MPFRSGTTRGTLLLLALVLAGRPSPASSQREARVRTTENFRREPNGVILGRLPAGTPLSVLQREGSWTQVELGGWVWLRSLQASDRDGFDLVVSSVDGENLRDAPGGEIIARFEQGALLQEVERDAAWARVRRAGWVWSASLDDSPGSSAGPMIQPEAPTFESVTGAREPGGFTSLGDAGAPVLTAPDGDTLAIAAPRSELELMGREGNWVRVRLEGWIWLPSAVGETSAPDPTPVAIEPAHLEADPSAYNGRVVSWELQFISLERAEAVRTDFFEGEPFLLARYEGADGPYVYVPVPAERLPEVEGLVPLERINVTGRVRTGASSLTGTPIVDLLSLERLREDP